MSKELLSTVLRVVKLPLYYMLYQGVFSVVAMIVAYCVAIANGLITQEILLAGDSAAVMSALPQSYMVWAISGGLFVSAAFMLWHLIFWGYFSFGKEPFRQVPGKAGFEEVLIAPVLTDKLSRLKGSRTVPAGMIEVAYEKQPAGVEFRIVIPEGLKAKFELGDVKKELLPGENQFVIVK